MRQVKVPRNILMGSATAATQIEGGDYNNNWYQWSQMGKLKGGVSSITACDHWNRVEEDTEIQKQLGMETYRMSIEWSRIEPEEGRFSLEGIQHYIHEIDGLLDAGIVPLVTLMHFSAPIWVQELGAWCNKKTVDYFLRFVERVVLELGDRVSDYCVINEPNVFVNDTYMEGKYPGGVNDKVFKYFKAAKNIIIAHVASYQLIHRLRKENAFEGETKVGVVPHLAYFEANHKEKVPKMTQKFIKYSFHDLFLKGMIYGKLDFPYIPKRIAPKGVYADFIGVNYYSRSIISRSKNVSSLFGSIDYRKDLKDNEMNDLGWEIYPQGLFHVTKEVFDTYKLPIYITENGIPDANDHKRKDFINQHLLQVVKLIDSGVDVQRYYYWSLLDNLEWDDGYGPRFGLVEVDYNTMERNIRDSAYHYRDIIKKRVIDVND